MAERKKSKGSVDDGNEITEFTKYERARMLGSRSLQISMGAPFLVKLSEDELKAINYNPLKIARMEFDKGVLPITVKRPLPGRRKKAAA